MGCHPCQCGNSILFHCIKMTYINLMSGGHSAIFHIQMEERISIVLADG
jgi:hypothetical protein